jgi:hypothetical protein
MYVTSIQKKSVFPTHSGVKTFMSKITPEIYQKLEAAYFDYTYFFIYAKTKKVKTSFRHNWLQTVRTLCISEKIFLQQLDKKLSLINGRPQ